MYNVIENEKYYVFTREGGKYEFKNYTALLYWIRNQYIKSIGNNWSDSYYPKLNWSDPYGILRTRFWYDASKKFVDFIVTDGLYRVINVEFLIRDLEKLPDRITRSWSYTRNYNGFRRDPVPHTGIRYHGNWLRRPRTTQELRRNNWDKKYARKRRCKRYLPNHWDDQPIGRFSAKSWKRQKKRKQWM